MLLLAVDPGTEVSGAVVYDTRAHKLVEIYQEIPNDALRTEIRGIRHRCGHMAIEMVASYGMAVGREVFETARWTGVFQQAFRVQNTTLVYRSEVKMHLCHSMRATDANIRAAILDLFDRTGGGATPQIGTKKEPGPLYGLKKHAVAALGVAITWSAANPQ